MLTIISGLLVARGFTRFDCSLRKPLFAIMIGTILIPGTVLLVPRYLIFRNLGLSDPYAAFWPTAAAGVPFFSAQRYFVEGIASTGLKRIALALLPRS